MGGLHPTSLGSDSRACGQSSLGMAAACKDISDPHVLETRLTPLHRAQGGPGGDRQRGAQPSVVLMVQEKGERK